MQITRHPGANQTRSQMVEAGDSITLVMTAADKSAGMRSQTEQTLAEIGKRLQSVGSDKSKIISILVYISDMNLWSEMDAAWQAWVRPGEAPSRACVQVVLAPTIMVEMVVYAVK